jgi:adenylate cyclase
MGTIGVTKNLGIEVDISIGPPLILFLFLGVSYGFIIGSLYYLLENKVVRNASLLAIIIYQTLLSLSVLVFLLMIGRYFLFESLLKYFMAGEAPEVSFQGWWLIVTMSLIYTLIMTILISFINQMNKKFGPGILLPMMLGRFRNPNEEYRVFMFLDLKESTPLAEKLGHVRYSKLIRDFFMDINSVVKKHFAEIYQYVGDEIVISWSYSIAFDNENCLKFFFACEDKINVKSQLYMKKYGVIPQFRAGLHCGVVTLVEVGDIKRDLAYHGDAINVASRVQSLSSDLNRSFLISKDIKSVLDESNSKYILIPLGLKAIRGKKEPIEIFGVEQA